MRIKKWLASIFLMLMLISCSRAGQTKVSEWKDVPLYPGYTEVKEADAQYTYKVQEDKSKVESFYKEQMTAFGWTDLGTGDININDSKETLKWFSKGDTDISVHLLPDENNSTQVTIIISQ